MKRLIKIFVYMHLFLAIVALLTHCSFKHHAERSFREAASQKPFDVIIVPGVPYRDGAESSVMKMRVLWAKHLYDNGYARNIIFSGSAVYTEYIEGVVMKLMADTLGIAPSNTFSETRAEHSTENVYYSWKMAKALGFEKVALATDPYQAGMLRGFIRKYCPEVSHIPIVYSELELEGRSLPVIDPSSALQPDFISITRREGFWTRLSGTMGRRVKEEVEAEERAEGIDNAM
jgi:uncharacterized SAM-binding protein YcdF (DUF218 family)